MFAFINGEGYIFYGKIEREDADKYERKSGSDGDEKTTAVETTTIATALSRDTKLVIR